MRPTLVTTGLVVLLVASGCLSSQAAPGAMSLTVSRSPVGLGDAFTVTVAISGYTGAHELDGYNFRILYDPVRFAVVDGSGTMHDSAGPAQNWLRFPAQENVTATSRLNDFTQFDPGVVHVAVADDRLAPDPLDPRGTGAEAGFLYELAFTALATGLGTIAIAPAVGEVVLHDAFLNPAGVPDLAGASASITVAGARLHIEPAGANQVTITWSTGRLETTDTLGASWTPVPGATNSLTVPAAGGQRFYRAVSP